MNNQKMARGKDCNRMYETADPCEHNLSPCVNKYGEGSCEGVDADRCEGKDPFNPNGGRRAAGAGGTRAAGAGPSSRACPWSWPRATARPTRTNAVAGRPASVQEQPGQGEQGQGADGEGFYTMPRREHVPKKAFRAYFCYLNFPRCYWDDRTDEMKSVPLCRARARTSSRRATTTRVCGDAGRSSG